MLRRFLVAFALGIATFVVMLMVSDLWLSARVEAVEEALMQPGMLVYALVAPEGIDSDVWVGWVFLPNVVNVLVYSLAWWVLLEVLRLARRKTSAPAA